MWALEPGEYVIDFRVWKTGRVTPGGLWRVKHEAWETRLSKGHRIIWLDQTGGAFDLPFPASEQRELARRLTTQFKKAGLPEPNDDGNIIDCRLCDLPKFLGAAG